MNAIDLFDAASDRMATGAALIECHRAAERSMSFAELASRSRRVATLFLRSGLTKGDAVLLLLPPGIGFYVACAAILRAGCIVLVPDPANWRESVRRAVRELNVAAFVGTAQACAARCVTPLLRRIPHAFVDAWFPGARSIADLDRVPPLEGVVECDSGAVALVSFTSGTTGPPKGVLRTHGGLAATQALLADALELVASETHLSVLPFVVLANLAAGVTSVLPDMGAIRPDRCDARRLAELIEAKRVDVVVASPAISAALARAAGRATLSCLRRIYLGGAPVLPWLYDLWAERAPHARVHGVYGATEVEPIALCRASDYAASERRSTLAGDGVLVGTPVEGLRVHILGPTTQRRLSPIEFERLIARNGEEGEVIVAGASVSPGYLGGAATDSKLAVGGETWHRTGDVGYLDHLGRIWLTGRASSGVRTSCGIVYPLRVEAALSDHPGIERAALVEHDATRLLVIQPRGGQHPDVQQALERVRFAMPDEVVFVDRIPLDPRHGAKTDYRTLTQWLREDRWQRHGGRPSPESNSALDR